MWHAIASNEPLSFIYEKKTTSITFRAGDGIEVIIVGTPGYDSGSTPQIYYAFPGKDVTISQSGTQRLAISIVPLAGNVMTRLNTEGTIISAEGAPGSYKNMQSFTDCTETPTNVTDSRNGVSYTVAKFGDRCFMLSNLRLESGQSLSSSDSDIKEDFTTPLDWSYTTSQPKMKACHGTPGNDKFDYSCDQSSGITEYYYNWYAAMANPGSGSLGTICPKNWTLPTYTTDVVPSTLWDGGNNPGILMLSDSIQGSGGGHQWPGVFGIWWSKSALSSSQTYTLLLNSNSNASRMGSDGNLTDNKRGFSVRCMR